MHQTENRGFVSGIKGILDKEFRRRYFATRFHLHMNLRFRRLRSENSKASLHDIQDTVKRRVFSTIIMLNKRDKLQIYENASSSRRKFSSLGQIIETNKIVEMNRLIRKQV